MALVSVATLCVADGNTRPVERAVLLDGVYQIDDEHPKLYFKTTQQGVPYDQESFGRAPELGKGWSWWCPLPHIATDRRFGLFEHFLKPIGVSLRCCLWPARLFDRSQMHAMVDAVEDELGRAIMWDRQRSPVRAYVKYSAARNLPLDRVLSTLRDELATLEPLRRQSIIASGSLEPENPDGLSSEETMAEDSLVAVWSSERLRLVRNFQLGLVATIESYEHTIRCLTGNPIREKQHQATLLEIRRTLVETRRLLCVLRDVAVRFEHCRSAFRFTPSMQRDHRLRKLLGVFKAPTQERLSSEVASLSALAPIKAPDLFELWGAVAIVRALRHLGWHAEEPVIGDRSGIGAVEFCTWELSKAGQRIVFDFQPIPRVMGPVPASHQRSEPALVWAGMQLAESDVLYSLGPRTPDYVLRWYSGSRRALIIGDASLADPKHQRERKVFTVNNYPPLVAWRAGNQFLRSDRGGAVFALFPGPKDRWETAIVEAASHDSYLLLPTPSIEADPELLGPLAHLLQRLDSVSVSY